MTTRLPPLPPVSMLLLLAVTLSPILALASKGDSSALFRKCLATCLGACDPSPEALTADSLALRLTGWTCADECRYDCMMRVTRRAMVEGKEVTQFYGKWPFERVLGIQEPASVIFSLANGWMHCRGFREISRRVLPGNPLRPWLLAWSAIGINTWVWSTIFHIRDKPWTEKLDYFSAGLSTTFALFLVLLRVYHLYPTSERPNPTRGLVRIGAGLSLLYLGHIAYLGLSSSFDYSYNIFYNVLIGLVHNGLWTLFSLQHLASPPTHALLRNLRALLPPTYPDDSRHPWGVWPAVIGLAFTAAMCLELGDFPPLGPGWLDAHAMWHAATIPIVGAWYAFFVQDANQLHRSLDVAAGGGV